MIKNNHALWLHVGMCPTSSIDRERSLAWGSAFKLRLADCWCRRLPFSRIDVVSGLALRMYPSGSPSCSACSAAVVVVVGGGGGGVGGDGGSCGGGEGGGRGGGGGGGSISRSFLAPYAQEPEIGKGITFHMSPF